MCKRLAAAVVLLAAVTLTVAATAQERTETRKKANLDTPFEISLVSNPSTGHEWQIDHAASAGLERVTIDDIGTSPVPQRRGKPLIGAPVIHTWLVTPQRTGVSRLVLIYLRALEREPPIKIHTFHIEISR